jgi:hypothetical protein
VASFRFEERGNLMGESIQESIVVVENGEGKGREVGRGVRGGRGEVGRGPEVFEVLTI